MYLTRVDRIESNLVTLFCPDAFHRYKYQNKLVAKDHATLYILEINAAF